MNGDKKSNQQGNFPVDDSINENALIQYTDLIQESAFLGNYPFNIIIDGIKSQFDNYVNLNDRTNYVDIFYKQLNESYDKIKLDDEPRPVEIREVLDGLYLRFIDTMSNLFETRLHISIAVIEDGEIYSPEVEYTLRKLYQFFILNARLNFTIAISYNIIQSLGTTISDIDEYTNSITDMIDDFIPLITTITPIQFLKYCGDLEVSEMFECGKFNGNFLKKYNPKLYQNEDLVVEIINGTIVTASYFKTIGLSLNKIK